MTRFDHALTREMAAMSASAFAALTSIFLVVILVRVLGKAAMGDLEVGAVLPMLAFGVLRFLPVLLSLGLFIGVFMCLSRIWRDSEAVIWMGGGVGPWDWARPVLLFSVPMVALIALVSFVGLPWAAKQQSAYQRILESRDEVSSMAPGMFTEFGQGKRVHFVESLSADGERVGNVFVQSQMHGRTGIMVASQGHIETQITGERFLVLEQGRRYEGNPGEADFRMGGFDSYAVRLQPQALAEAAESPRMLTMGQLWAQPNPRNMGELVWRVGYPLSALMLVLLAVPLSYVNPRAGRSMNVVFAILIYLAYNNFVGLSEGWVTRSRLNPGEALFLVHGGMLLVLAAFYWQRFRGPWAR
ncbi:MAG: LPS export ABC transporter permease LptF [Thiobacillus sp.]|nr:LPS export ABC transporter permease LptF [Thiobacillus sp.]